MNRFDCPRLILFLDPICLLWVVEALPNIISNEAITLDKCTAVLSMYMQIKPMANEVPNQEVMEYQLLLFAVI